MDYQISHVDFRLVDKFKNPFDWAKTFLPLISDCIYREDYEAAKACSDAIREFLNEFLDEGDKIKEDATLNLPEIKAIKINGIICYIDPKKPLG